MRPITNPADDLRLSQQRGEELRRFASEQRMLRQRRSALCSSAKRSAAVPGIFQPAITRRILAIAAVVMIASGVGVWATRAEAAQANQTDPTTCEFADGYRPACSMLPGHPDGWFSTN